MRRWLWKAVPQASALSWALTQTLRRIRFANMGIQVQKDPYFFGEFELDVERGLLIRSNGESTALRRQSLQVLRLLLDQAPSLVSKETLLDSVWGRQAVSESVVAQVIKELRQLLGDSAAQPGYIETRQRQGYRVLVPVLRQRPETVTEREVIATPMVAAENVRVQHSPARRLKSLYVIVGSSFALALLIAMLLLGGSGTRKPPASQLAHLRLDFRHAPSNLAGTTLSELRFVADAMLARGDIGPLQAHASTQRQQAPDAFSRGIIDVIELRSAGRDFDALARVEALLGVAPDDLPLRLLHQELAFNWRSKSRVVAFVEPQLPPERQALLDARYAGLFGDAEGQAKAAQTAMARGVLSLARARSY
jgi:DNA-binding winged helix-turn-helix (wHTH) protein